jgi:tRNA modification GTPase
MNHPTIAAIATPLGPGGIGIIRISGPDSYVIMQKLFIRGSQQNNEQTKPTADNHFTSHRIYYGHIQDPTNAQIIDEVLAVFMAGPKSFTREDVLEIHSHSGFVVLDKLLSAVVDAGAGLANPGDFTKRAFVNGRIDLTQAEAVIDLINAPCETAVYMANNQICGGLRHAIEQIVSQLMTLRANLEADIEFGEHAESPYDSHSLRLVLNQKILPKINALIQNQKNSAIFKYGALLSIAGVPNVGKSSLLNRLVSRETAIVSEVPGTTRDIVKAYFSIKGIPVTVCDTAGIHDSTDPVECIGMEKAKENFQQADIVLLVLEATRPLNQTEKRLVADFNQKATVAVINKNDIADDAAKRSIEKQLADVRHIWVSAKTGSGLEKLKHIIYNDLIMEKEAARYNGVTPNLRQCKILESAQSALQNCDCAAQERQPVDIISEYLDYVINRLYEISGDPSTGDLYDHIFDQFCIGK